mmetsp:Transcript_72763/g.128210  ORF Transcript_72763/g.128210 Transcript_72763/m.128210 type:complete len:231 (-) Transcript_72763:138-830(-)
MCWTLITVTTSGIQSHTCCCVRSGPLPSATSAWTWSWLKPYRACRALSEWEFISRQYFCATVSLARLKVQKEMATCSVFVGSRSFFFAAVAFRASLGGFAFFPFPAPFGSFRSSAGPSPTPSASAELSFTMNHTSMSWPQYWSTSSYVMGNAISRGGQAKSASLMVGNVISCSGSQGSLTRKCGSEYSDGGRRSWGSVAPSAVGLGLSCGRNSCNKLPLRQTRTRRLASC